MTESKAIKDIKRQLQEITSEDADITLSTESLKMAIKALEKQIAKKPCVGNDEQGDITCPHCKGLLGIVDCWELHSYKKYCPTCGQKLDWE